MCFEELGQNKQKTYFLTGKDSVEVCVHVVLLRMTYLFIPKFANTIIAKRQ